ncbi:MAG: 30S ribosomal protein S2, partial [Planctomycetes bacterium]|nr:30S ribosomal protein S2 [Planctomycetota bacterium]
HYGHSTRFWNPRMKPYIFSRKNGVHIIDVKETLRGAIRARNFLGKLASGGLDILIVGTKKQAASIVRTESQRAGMPFVATRWLGGCLTNHSTIRKRLARLEEIEHQKATGIYDKLKKKERAVVDREYAKVAFNFDGLRNLDKLPSAIFVVDVMNEKNAVNEARKLNIPVVGIVDTNSNPEGVDIVIPANDDSLRGLQIILRYIIDGIVEGKRAHEQGGGLKDVADLRPSSYDEMESEDEGGRGRGRGKGGRGGDRRGGGRTRQRGGRSEEKVAEVSQSQDEALAAAEAQGKELKAQVRIKPKAASTDAAPAAPAPAPEADKPAE